MESMSTYLTIHNNICNWQLPRRIRTNGLDQPSFEQQVSILRKNFLSIKYSHVLDECRSHSCVSLPQLQSIKLKIQSNKSINNARSSGNLNIHYSEKTPTDHILTSSELPLLISSSSHLACLHPRAKLMIRNANPRTRK